MKTKTELSEQEQQRELEIQAVRALNISRAMYNLEHNQYRIQTFFYAAPTESGISGLELNENETSFIVGTYKEYNHYTRDMQNRYVIISEKVQIGLHYPMTICDEVGQAYMVAERENGKLVRITDKEEIYKLQLFLASVFGIA